MPASTQPTAALPSASASTELVIGEDGLARPPWASQDQLLMDYYDTEWGMPIVDERGVFERLCLEIFQSGLSWRLILQRRPLLRAAFSGFDVDAVAEFGDDDLERLMLDAGVIRNRLKISSIIKNARATIVLRESEPLHELVWSAKPQVTPRPTTVAEVPSSSEESRWLTKQLKARGFSFVGPTNLFALMEAIGVVDTHLVGSHRRGSSGVWPES
ncbi:DNA-3-methyladenine glycosylase I [Pseudoclavibacter sp. Z016]|uniref:DNA-3-methyladenine glycosylase I n=1 Tax=Pseudoclavibacter sp. Z016 TaxID=2080581 RepID=UPI000CE7E428|nr:DNA-3-methyladenine glycosylase I [Pseudoclavibacter sp. Z016]PPF76124.1 3-methyladenine DNA glycosylase [Pseudoclavibacter sp. Z016]